MIKVKLLYDTAVAGWGKPGLVFGIDLRLINGGRSGQCNRLHHSGTSALFDMFVRSSIAEMMV
jgi:hypothetical protein